MRASENRKKKPGIKKKKKRRVNPQVNNGKNK